jgi:hypothetical protein
VIAWGSTAENSAVGGLVTLLRRQEWRNHPDGERVRQLLIPVLDSPDDTVRMLATIALPVLVNPQRLTEAICDRLSTETNASVLHVLTAAAEEDVVRDPIGIDACLRRLAAVPAWSALAPTPEDRSVPPNQRHTEASDGLLRILLHLSLFRTAPFAISLIAAWEEECRLYPATLGRLVAMGRPYLNPSSALADSQARAFTLLASLTNTCVDIVSSANAIVASGSDLNDDQHQDLQAAAFVAHCIARELYHASGAFRNPQQRALPDDRVVSPAFCALSLPIIEKLTAVPSAEIAHHLVQTLVFLSREEPRRSFLLVAKIVTARSGYQYESLAETEVLDYVDVCLAERRALTLDDPECLSGLRQILETFVDAGCDRAIRRVQDLAELFV